MAGADLPDTLTPEQAAKLGLVPKASAPLSMPDVLTPEQAKRMGLIDDAPAAPAGADMTAGSAARRARAGKPPGPRDITAEEAGTSAGPVTTIPHTIAGLGTYEARQPLEPAFTPPEEVHVRGRFPGSGFGPLGMLGRPSTLVVEPPSGEMADPLVQMMTSTAMGRGAGALTGGIGNLVSLPRTGAALAPVVESGVANKSAGGDFSVGAALAAPGLVRAGKQAIRAGAPERVAERSVRNLTETAKQTTADKVTRAVGPDGSRLRAVVDRNPELRKALAVQAKEKPVKALSAVEKTSAKANAALDDDFAKMREHYADKPASAQTSVPQLLDDVDKALTSNKGDHEVTSALRRARQFLIDDFGADGIITPDELRRVKQSIGRAAFPASEAASQTVKARVNQILYQPVRKQLQTLAKNTPGIDVERFMNLNEDVSALIPVKEALREKIKKQAQGKKPIGERIKGAARFIATGGGLAVAAAAHNPAVAAAVPVGIGAAKLGARAARGLDFRLAEQELRGAGMPMLDAGTALGAPLSVGAAAAAIDKDRSHARRVTDAMSRGMSLKDAVAAADAEDD